jgi:hypothetical protein
MQTIIETPAYLSDAKVLGLTDAERTAIVDAIAHYPRLGDVIPGTGGARKIRFAGRGKGKSGAIASLPSTLATISRSSYSTSLPREKKSI